MTDSNLVGNAVVAQSNSQYISIVPENGEQFNPGQKIVYNIEPEVGFVKKDSYLVFDVLNNSIDESRYCLQKNIGAHALIERVDIFSKETGVLLESNTHYAQWCNIEKQYLMDSHTSGQNYEGVGEPVQSWTHQVSAANVATSSRSIPSPAEIANNNLSPVTTGANGGAPAYTSRRFCIPLKAGLFCAYGGEEKAVPVLAFGGLRIEITLAKARMALQDLGWRYKDTGLQGKDRDAFFDWRSGNVLTDGLADNNTANNFIDVKITPGGNKFFTNDLQDVGLCVGNQMRVTNIDEAAGAARQNQTYLGHITNITGSDVAARTINGVTSNFFNTITLRIAGNTPGFNGIAAGAIVTKRTDPSYKIMGTEFRLLQLVPSPQVADAMTKGINYEFNSYDVFFDNIPTTALRHQVPIHSVASKALATFTMLMDTTNDEGQTASAADFFTGALPNAINLNDVVYFINNRLYPLRSYNPQNKGDKVLATNELVKAWRALGKQPMCLGNADYGDMENYTNTPLIARELARNNMVFDLRNAEPELRLSFSGARANTLRVHTFVFSKKIVQTTATGVQVIH